VDPPADTFSDLDLALITTDPDRYLRDAGWLEHIGTPWLTFVERQATGAGLERRALFERDLDVDFAILERDEVQKMVAGDWPPEISAVLARGFEFILDKDGLEHSMRRDPPKPPRARVPTSDEFLSLCSDFLYHAMWAAKKLRRGELWVAKSCADDYMKQQLLQMLTWHARATHGPGYDTWHKGRFLESWADPRVLGELHQAFAHYDEADIQRALSKTVELFRWVAKETAADLGYRYPDTDAERVTAWIAAPSE
jgi:aminoglycoside 6-adenylyltransferase